MDVLLFDVSKAFDSVPHTCLIQKLRWLGIGGYVLDWIVSFLSDRSQKVFIHSAVSDSIPVTSDVVQGSVIGPTLFSAYLYGIGACFKFCKHFLYADDLKLCCVLSNGVTPANIQEDLDRLVLWMLKHGLKFNVAKCVVLHYGSCNPKFKYNLNGVFLTDVTESADLGLHRSCDLKYATHIQTAIKKAYGVCACIYSVYTSRNKNVLLPLYLSFVRPLLDFASPVWYPWAVYWSKCLEQVQKRLTKRISGM